MSGGTGETGERATLPIADHGVIGDLRTAALVATDGRVDWFCAPRFDSPSVFGSLLDADEGGFWEIEPVCDVTARHQFYFPDTNILITRLLTVDGMVEIQDFMPVLRPHDPDHRQRLVRRVSCVRGSMTLRARIAPRPDYGRADVQVTSHEQAVDFHSPDLLVRLRATVELEVEGADAVTEFCLEQGEAQVFVLTCGEEACAVDGSEPVGPDEATGLFDATVGFWRSWISHSRYTGRWRERVHRSALTLKLLTHEPTGAIVAAPTMGLPEVEGGERNWDYRYVWIRDAAFSLYALLRLGFMDEAEAFIGWLARCLRDAHADGDGPLRPMYTIDGAQVPAETTLGHLRGYGGASPVRLGNGAAEQSQLDVYGEIVDSVYLFDKHGPGISHETWTDLRRVLDWLMENWDQADESIWEPRVERQHHTYSRLMCWVAVERMIRMARRRGLPGDIARWSGVRDAIYEQIMERAWNPETAAFTQTVAGPGQTPASVVDASLLIMPMVKFIAPNDPRFRSTMAAMEKELVVDSLVFRYQLSAAPDGLDGSEGTFSLCSFWWVEALTRGGRSEEARVALEKMFTYSNHVGLYAEQIGVTGRQLGNFPQAFTHLALISAAVNLDRVLP
ncbi:glycoside hydrolase family 15 protein [Streptomyces sp. NPDC049916]|uniref:glycoside hydrolase family 15 protein n=1 Tax=Streptomyces sp. NPDC049916 TaxID=3155156 RepID=UPI00343ED283